MKNVKMIIATMLFFLVTTVTVKAQDAAPANYFVGKWSVLVEGTPSGDATNTVTIELKDDKLVGTIFTKGSTEPKPFTKITQKGNSITAYFVASGYDVYLFLEKIDENKALGSMLDMFDATAQRIIETENK